MPFRCNTCFYDLSGCCPRPRPTICPECGNLCTPGKEYGVPDRRLKTDVWVSIGIAVAASIGALILSQALTGRRASFEVLMVLAPFAGTAAAAAYSTLASLSRRSEPGSDYGVGLTVLTCTLGAGSVALCSVPLGLLLAEVFF
ncbi:MAG: hypothetical protein WD749_03265 [Phycisphaerales bacterium]